MIVSFIGIVIIVLTIICFFYAGDTFYNVGFIKYWHIFTDRYLIQVDIKIDGSATSRISYNQKYRKIYMKNKVTTIINEAIYPPISEEKIKTYITFS